MKKEVAAEDEADEAVAVPEPEGCLIGVDEARGLGVAGAGQAPWTMFNIWLASPKIRMVMSSLV